MTGLRLPLKEGNEAKSVLEGTDCIAVENGWQHLDSSALRRTNTPLFKFFGSMGTRDSQNVRGGRVYYFRGFPLIVLILDSLAWISCENIYDEDVWTQGLQGRCHMASFGRPL